MQVLGRKAQCNFNNTFHALGNRKLGMSVSYDRVMDIRKGLTLAVSKRFAEDGVVVPSNISRGVFTSDILASLVINIDEYAGA